GPHPAGNVGIQIHHIDPINKGDVVWTVNPLDVIIIGRLFLKGVYDATKVIALAGSDVVKPRYYRIVSGARVDSILKDNLVKTDNEHRIISGNVLTGAKVESIGFIGFYDNMVTVIPEGKHHEFFGWMAPGFNKHSASRTFFSKLLPGKSFKLDTNINGGERAYVLTGQYEKVLPMDIYPVHLIKAILANDIDKMEQLGIYEVVEEDLALCEYVCTSKVEVQEILRKGIESMIKELS
ncbi:MAG TPA: NADH:ubiquinone reductase (Na(+)-transporting) subunit A, partial [Tenuifilaceae bacterium]|nr:NADH:ubiquinone reductase (Na(+)-transporting) subunit A [Tenuifilaceae bacterium]